MSRLLLIALLALLALAYALPTAQAHYTYSDSDADAETEADSLDGVDQEVLDSAAQEIESSAEYTAELNESAPYGSETAIYADSTEAAAMEQDAIPEAEPGKETFAFLAELESPKNEMAAVDVEQHLDTIATEIGSLFQTAAAKKAQAEKAQAEAFAHSRKGRLAAKKAAHAQAVAAKRAAAAVAAKAVPVVMAAPAPVAPVAAAPAPSKRQQKLISRLDGYRVARGHTEDVSVLEATAKSSQAVGNGYSMPSAYAPGAVVAGLAPAAPFNPFQGQPIINPALAAGNNALLQSLGLGLPAAAPAVRVAAPGLAGVGNLLQALQKIKQEQENKALLSTLATLLTAQKPAAPAVIPSPFNYGQSLVATPNGFVNPNLLPQTFGPRLLPGQLPGQSPSYPTFIPAGNAAVGVGDDQPNPFEDHKP